MSTWRLRTFLLVVAALLVQTAVLVRVRPAGVIPDVMLLLAIAAGVVGGPERGAITGFAAGIAIDLFLQTPVGLSALAFSLVGHIAGLVTGGMVRAARWIEVATTVVASIVGVVVFAIAGEVVGEPLVSTRLVTVALVVAVCNGVLTPVALRLMRWALSDGGTTRLVTA